MKKYDYLIVGAGLYGSIFAHEMTKAGKTCLVIDKREHIGGNAYTKSIEGINTHIYGAHIFHTSDEKVWNYINQFTSFNNYINAPIANYKGEIYNLPFNMNTFNKMWGVITPEEALKKIEEEKNKSNIIDPKNLEEQAISLVGKEIYEKLIAGYTKKQWGRECKELPSFIIRRLPVRFTYDNNYFNDKYQGIPNDGYTKIFENLLQGIEVHLNCNFFKNKDKYKEIAHNIVFTGCIDEYFDYCYGPLEYRSVRFETKVFECENLQGNAVVNYTDDVTPYTRVIEHKHFEFGRQPKTVVSYEYSDEWNKEKEPYYPVNNDKNTNLYLKYKDLANKEKNVIFGGRLGDYKYYDMDKVISAALETIESILNKG